MGPLGQKSVSGTKYRILRVKSYVNWVDGSKKGRDGRKEYAVEVADHQCQLTRRLRYQRWEIADDTPPVHFSECYS